MSVLISSMFCVYAESTLAEEIPISPKISSASEEFIEPDLVIVPRGRAVIGGEGYPTDTPRRIRTVDAFLLGKQEVTEQEMRCFYEWLALNDESDPYLKSIIGDWITKQFGVPNLPATSVNWILADSYVKWLTVMSGKQYRLPTEIEWEFAASGPEKRAFPWGNTYSRDNFNGYSTLGLDTFDLFSPVGSFPAGNTVLGISDMSGNVMEWCSNMPVTYTEPILGEYIGHLQLRVARGGHAEGKSLPFDQVVGHREIRSTDGVLRYAGFRAAMDIVEHADLSSQAKTNGLDIFLALQKRSKDLLLQIPIGSESRPWVILHTLIAVGYRQSIPDADQKDRPFLPIDTITYRHTFETPKDADRRLILVDEKWIKVQQGGKKYFLEDHKGQTIFVFSQIELPEFYELSVGPRGAFLAYDLLGSTTYETHGFEDLSWILPAVAYYRGEWSFFTNRFGEKLYVNDLVKRFMKTFNDRTDRPCYATHYHYCLAYLRWYDSYVPIIDDEARSAIDTELEKYYKTDLDAVKEDLAKVPSNPSEADDDTLFQAVYSVGHRLEWTALWAKHRKYDRSQLYPLFESFTNLIEASAPRLKRADQNPPIYGSICHGVHGFALLEDR